MSEGDKAAAEGAAQPQQLDEGAASAVASSMTSTMEASTGAMESSMMSSTSAPEAEKGEQALQAETSPVEAR